MSFIAEAHSHWHLQNGRYEVCPWDCQAQEALEHMSDQEIADYSANLEAARNWEPSEEDMAPCEHGMSSWLCAGPNHYPDDSMDW